MGNILAAPCLPIMHCLGFTASGIARGSVAALTHSCIGIVHAGSCFARCQAAAASSSPCGCIVVLLCWVVVLMSLAFWIFGLPLWLQDVWGWWNGADHKNATGTPGY
ncbi:hypothetical protein Fcan01_14660 [Folsomia candida]|uniref:Uncharacterized protein n=1 Tax=Folsomia candida TaxID=158441 RepID=A0A226E1F2_FOLCA|nr:hypothetical protein Fcan01_14660 [Folsomia candida]